MFNLKRFVQFSIFVFVLGLAVATSFVRTASAQEVAGNELEQLVQGSWKLESYAYESDGRTYLAPDEMEALAKFEDGSYEVEFSTYIKAVGIKRTRKASEAGTYFVDNNTIRLLAEAASNDAELGEELLSDVVIEGDTMRLTSNNGSNHEVWTRVVE